MRKRSMAVLGMAAALGISLSAATTASAQGVVGDWAVWNSNSGKCLAIPGGSSAANGTTAIQYACDNPAPGVWDADQVWTWTLVSGATSTYTLKNKATDRCLAIGGASHTAGAEAIQWTCNGNTEQQWIDDSTGRLRNKESNLCLTIGNASTANSSPAIQWTCEAVTSNPEQQWFQVR
ncbi:RICIN domain-containing protein [Streptomyces hokutonensis]|uniref:RICIN domain-containing protein n=1 Tax=Streptomyces hokutonensis TaxID=1306990 RepID=UPI003689BD6D